MRKFAQPIVIVSQCLEFDKCRYNGQVIPAKFVRTLQSYVQFKKVCPEVEIGLGIPRDPIKLVEQNNKIHLVQPSTRRDLTKKMQSFSKNYLSSLEEVDGFILKANSPSCGIRDTKIFVAMDNPIAKAKDAGMFARAVLDQYPGLAIEDEGRLTNFRLREHFLTKLFLLADFRKLKKTNSMKRLVEFHSCNKLLFMAYNQKYMRLLGQVVANPQKRDFKKVIAEYQNYLYHALNKVARYTSHINVLMHALGYFKKHITAKEKAYFLKALYKYREETLPLSAVISIIHSWIIRFDIEYLGQQTYFEPYPEGLTKITDSGLGRNGRY